MEQSLQRRTRHLNGAIFKVVLRDALVSLRDEQDAVSEGRLILQFRLQDLRVKHLAGVVEHASDKPSNEPRRDSVAQTAGRNLLPVVLIILDLLQKFFLNQITGLAFFRAQTTPDFRNEQADVMVDPYVRSDVTGRRREPIQTGQQITDECIVEVGNRSQRVERTFGECPFAAGSGGRGTLAGQRRNEIHEQFGKFLVVNRVVDGERPEPLLVVGRIVSSPEKHCVNRDADRTFCRHCSKEPHTHFGDVTVKRLHDVGASLQVARVLARLAVNDSRSCRTHNVTVVLLSRLQKQLLHRRGERAEVDRSLADLLDILARKRLEIHDEIIASCEVRFGLLVEAAVNGIVRTLEQPKLAVLYEFVTGRRRRILPEIVQPISRDDDRSADVVFGLNLLRGREVLSQPVHSPDFLAEQTHSQKVGDDLPVSDFQFVPRHSVDDVHTEMRSPVKVFFAGVKPLDREHQPVDVPRDRSQPLVVLFGVVDRRSQQLDDAPECSVRIEDFSCRLLRVVRLNAAVGSPAVGVISIENLLDAVEVALDVVDENRPVQDVIGNRFTDLALATAADGAGFVTEDAFGKRADQPPRGCGRMFIQSQLVPGRSHVDVFRANRD